MSESSSDLEDVDLTDFDTGEKKSGGKFKKNSDDSSRRTSSTISTSMQLQLNRLSDREVDDSNMKSVFGPAANKPAPDSMRVNPLYEKGVTPANDDSQPREVLFGSGQNYDGPSEVTTRSNGKEEEPTILYTDNFKLKNKDSPPSKPKVAKFGRIIPARVKRNTHRTSILQSVTRKKDTPPDEPISKERMELIEASLAHRRIRRGCRYAILLILAFLVFSLLLVLILYFATQ